MLQSATRGGAYEVSLLGIFHAAWAASDVDGMVRVCVRTKICLSDTNPAPPVALHLSLCNQQVTWGSTPAGRRFPGGV